MQPPILLLLVSVWVSLWKGRKSYDIATPCVFFVCEFGTQGWDVPLERKYVLENFRRKKVRSGVAVEAAVHLQKFATKHDCRMCCNLQVLTLYVWSLSRSEAGTSCRWDCREVYLYMVDIWTVILLSLGVTLSLLSARIGLLNAVADTLDANDASKSHGSNLV